MLIHWKPQHSKMSLFLSIFSIFLKFIYRFGVIHIKILTIFFVDIIHFNKKVIWNGK